MADPERSLIPLATIIMKQDFFERLAPLAPAILRWSMALVYLWFGFAQLQDVQAWVDWVPEWAVGMTHMRAEMLVTGNGIFELVFGTLLLVGVFTRVSALLLAVHMMQITFDVGYGAIGVRDFGLTMATLVVFLNGNDYYAFGGAKRK